MGNVARILGLLLLGLGVLIVLRNRGLRRVAAFHWLVLSLYLYFCCSYFWTADADATVEKIRAYFQVMMIVWLVWEFGVTPEHLRGLVRAFVAGCWVLAILTFLNFSSTAAMSANQVRFVADGQDPNDVARFLDLGLPFGALLFATERTWLVRIIAIAYLPVGLLAAVLTASRGGLAGAIVAVLGGAILVVRWRPGLAGVVLAAMATAVGGLVSMVPRETLERLATIPEQVGTSDFNDRATIWISGWDAFTKAPWLGYGAGNYAIASGLSAGDTAHNTLMAVLVTGGLVGIGLFAAVLVFVGRAVWQTRGLVRIGLATVVVVVGITSMVGSVEENRTTWLIFGLVVLAARMQREQRDAIWRVFSGDKPVGANAVKVHSLGATGVIKVMI